MDHKFRIDYRIETGLYMVYYLGTTEAPLETPKSYEIVFKLKEEAEKFAKKVAAGLEQTDKHSEEFVVSIKKKGE